MPDREKIIEGLTMLADRKNDNTCEGLKCCKIAEDALSLLNGQKDIVHCKDCKWYDERISLCDNCGLPREQTFFCADGKRRIDNA